jgi:hypothetical protein
MRLQHRWFQFSIRSLLLLTLAVACVCAFWVRPALDQRAALASLRGHCTDVTYDVPSDPRTGRPIPALVPMWLVDRLGIDFFANVTGLEVYNATDDILGRLKAFPRLTTLVLHGTDMTTDEGLTHVGQLGQLQVLGLSHTKTNDGRLSRLRGLKKLELLELSDTQVTDSGLAALAGLTELREIHLRYTAVTDGGVATLRRALPRCVVKRHGSTP